MLISFMLPVWLFIWSYLAVVASLLLMHIKPAFISRIAENMIEQMREGWDYVRAFGPIRGILLLYSIVCLVGYSYTVLLLIYGIFIPTPGATPPSRTTTSQIRYAPIVWCPWLDSDYNNDLNAGGPAF
jgi:hypothetical protein